MLTYVLITDYNDSSEVICVTTNKKLAEAWIDEKHIGAYRYEELELDDLTNLDGRWLKGKV